MNTPEIHRRRIRKMSRNKGYSIVMAATDEIRESEKKSPTPNPVDIAAEVAFTTDDPADIPPEVMEAI